MMHNHIGQTVYIYGAHEGTVTAQDEAGAIVQERDDNSETWFPWRVLEFETTEIATHIGEW